MDLRADDAGRVPFSLVAVLVLVLANASALYVWTVNRSGAESELDRAELRAMDDVASASHTSFVLQVRYLALDVLRTSDVPGANESRLNVRLAARLAELRASTFPREVRGFVVDVGEASASILLSPRRTMDIVPSSASRRSEVGAASVEGLDTLHLGVFEMATRIAYYSLSGTVNYTITKGLLELRTARTFVADLDSPLPVIESALSGIEGAADGTGAEMGRIVRYMLTTVAQYRVLQGYAAGAYGVPGSTTADILTTTDVEVAVNLALLLEEIRRFRAVDPSAVAAVDTAFFELAAGSDPSGEFAAEGGDRALSRLLTTYANDGYVDPADLFALFGKMDAEPIRLNAVLAQAISAIVDQYTLRYLEYFGLAGLADLALEVVELLAAAVQDFLDWITGHDREADLVTGFVRDFVDAMGGSTVILGPASVDIPQLDYDVTAEDGSTVRITVPAHRARIPLEAQDVTKFHDSTWKSYYGTLFAGDLKRVHESARDFIADLARRIASDAGLIGAIPNPELRGHIDPKDETSILAYVDGRMQTAVHDAVERLRSEPAYLEALVSNLWRHQVNLSAGLFRYVHEKYDELANATEAIPNAREILWEDLLDLARRDPDWSSLDERGRRATGAAIGQTIAMRRWVERAYEAVKLADIARFDDMARRAADLGTPAAQGGIYERIVATVASTTGILRQAGDLIREFSEGLAGAGEAWNAQVLLPVSGDPFAFWSDGGDVREDGRSPRYERLWVRQEPAALRATVVGGSESWSPGAVRVGDLWIDVRDPASRFGDASRNTHYANVRELSRRPYESQWDIRILGMVRIRSGTERAVFLGPEGHAPAVGSALVPVRMSLSLRIASGWPLQGVSYASSATLGADVWNAIVELMDTAWEGLAYAFDWILDALTKIAESIVDLLRQLASYAAELLKVLVESVRKTVELLQDWIAGVIGALVPALEEAIAARAAETITVQAWGITFELFWGSPEPGTRLQVNATGDWFYVETRFVYLNESSATEEQLARVRSPWDIVGYAEFTVSNVTVMLDVDPLMVLQDHIVEGVARPAAGGWELAFSVPDLEVFEERAWELVFPTIPTPIGTLDLEVGIRVRLSGPLGLPGFVDALRRSFDEAFDVFKGRPIDFEAVGLFATTLVERFLFNALQAIEDELSQVKEVVLYVEGVFRAGGVAGGGFRLAFVAEGEAFVSVFRWLADNLLAYFRHFLIPSAPADYPSLPMDAMDHLLVRGEVLVTIGMPKLLQKAAGNSVPGEFRLTFRIQANVPAIANLFGEDWGRWRVDFGAYIERVPAAIAGPLFGVDPEADVDVWLLRGSVREV